MAVGADFEVAKNENVLTVLIVEWQAQILNDYSLQMPEYTENLNALVIIHKTMNAQSNSMMNRDASP